MPGKEVKTIADQLDFSLFTLMSDLRSNKKSVTAEGIFQKVKVLALITVIMTYICEDTEHLNAVCVMKMMLYSF